jgi:hypothetical protein
MSNGITSEAFNIIYNFTSLTAGLVAILTTGGEIILQVNYKCINNLNHHQVY